jgi:glutamyl-tRNA synthetase
MVEMAEGATFYYRTPESYDPEAAAKFLTTEQRPVLEAVLRRMETLDDYSAAGIEGAFADVMTETGLKLGKIGPPVRVALTGGTVSPGVYEVIAVLGRERTAERLRRALTAIG